MIHNRRINMVLHFYCIELIWRHVSTHTKLLLSERYDSTPSYGIRVKLYTTLTINVSSPVYSLRTILSQDNTNTHITHTISSSISNIVICHFKGLHTIWYYIKSHTLYYLFTKTITMLGTTKSII